MYNHLCIYPSQLNLTPFADQTVAGALLLIPGLVDLIVMTPLFFRWLNQIEEQTRLADERRQERVEHEEYERKRKNCRILKRVASCVVICKDELCFSEEDYFQVQRRRKASLRRFSYILRGISVTPNVCQMRRRKLRIMQDITTCLQMLN